MAFSLTSLLLVLVLMAPGHLLAQSESGSAAIAGTARDDQGGVNTIAIRHEVDEVEPSVRSLFGQQRSKYVARLMRLSSGLVKWKSSAISGSSAHRSLVAYAS